MNTYLLEKFDEIERFHWWWEGRRKLVDMFLPKKVGMKILDIGCGTGETMSFVKKIRKGSVVYGVDTSVEAVRYTKKRGHKLVYRADARKLPFAAVMFDAVLILDVLEHIVEHDRVLSEARRVLKPGGVVIVTSPALPIIWSAHDDNQGHVRRYTRETLLKVAKKSGLETEKVSYFNFVLAAPIMAIRLASRIPGFGFLASYNNGINYEVAHVGAVNALLRRLFVGEVGMIEALEYPIGISVVGVFSRPNTN